MNNPKTMIKNSILFISIFVITFMIIFHNYDFNETMNLILEVNIIYVILGIILMLFYFSCESMNVKNILSYLGIEVPFINTFKYTSICKNEQRKKTRTFK